MNSMKNSLRNFLRQSCALVVAFFVTFSASAVVYHVDPVNGDDGNLGLSWTQALETFQEALDRAGADDDIWVAIGTYKPGALQSDSFIIPLEVKVFGGFPIGGGDGTFEARDPNLFDDTILSGDIDNNDINSPALMPGDIVGNNSFHVVTIIDDDAAEPFIFGTEVDGFLITAGNALYSGVGDNETGGGGGAFVIDKDPPLIPDSAIREGPLFRNCIFQGNRADRAGGAIAALDVGLEVRDCQILNNESDGGIIVGDVNNTTTENGGGISGIGPMIVVNSTLIGNICTGLNSFARGGGLSVAGWHADNIIAVASCFFASNEAQDDPADPGKDGVGGGAVISAAFSDEAHVMNCVFIKNVAYNNLEAGGGMSVTNGVEVTLCTFYENSAPNGVGGGLVFVNNPVNNCIAWNNTDKNSTLVWRAQLHGTGLDACPTYSNIESWDCGFCDAQPPGCGETFHNICADPEFLDPDGPDNILGNADDDLSLTMWSPSIEKGNDDLIPLDWGDVDDDGPAEILPWDIAKNTRDSDAGFDTGTGFDIDQGAYEFQCPACPWDLDHSNVVDSVDLFILRNLSGERCVAADFVLPDKVGAEDQIELLAHWGSCSLCLGGGGGGGGSNSSSEWDPQVVSAVELIGFAGQADYTNWLLNVATEAEMNNACILLEVILDE